MEGYSNQKLDATGSPGPSGQSPDLAIALMDLQNPERARMRAIQFRRYDELQETIDGRTVRDGYPTPRDERILQRIELETGFSPDDPLHEGWDKAYYTKWRGDEINAIVSGLYKFKGIQMAYGKAILPFPDDKKNIVYDVNDPEYKGLTRKLLDESHPLAVEQKKFDDWVESEVAKRLHECRKILGEENSSGALSKEVSQRKSGEWLGITGQTGENCKLISMKLRLRESGLDRIFWNLVEQMRVAIAIARLVVFFSLGYLAYRIAWLHF